MSAARTWNEKPARVPKKPFHFFLVLQIKKVKSENNTLIESDKYN